MFKKIVSRLLPRAITQELTSSKLREQFLRDHDIEVGMYSYGCFDPSRIGRKVRIGRYCSFAPNVHVYTRNHGINFLSTTPYLYNGALGLVDGEIIPHSEIVFEDDVWVGHGAVVLPSVRRIGRGAIIAAGSVVTRDVEPYTITGGNPAKTIRARFSEAVIARIEAIRWWEWDIETFRERLAQDPQLFFDPDKSFTKEFP